MRCVREFEQGASRRAGHIFTETRILVKEKGGSSMANPEYVLEMRTKAKCSTIKHREDERSSSFWLLVNLHNTDCIFSFFFIAFPL